MGFECALAIVLPLPSLDLVDFYPSEAQVDVEDWDDISFDGRVRVNVPGREWKVLRFLDFGQVRRLVKTNSSLSPEKRASGTSEDRAAKCAASFLMDIFFQWELEACKGNLEYLVPFVADHLLYTTQSVFDIDDFSYSNRFSEVFKRLGCNDVVTGLWSPNLEIEGMAYYKTSKLKVVTSGFFWEYNHLLLRGDVAKAILHYSPPCGLIWNSSYEIAKQLSLLLLDEGVTGRELRKDPLSVALVCIWRDMFQSLSAFGARVIFLTGGFHLEASRTIRSQQRYL